MTALVGGSLLLIVGAAIALVIGWIAADESLIWASIAASIAAAVMLSLGYHRSKAEAARRPAPEPERATATPPTVAPRAATPAVARREPPPTQATPLVAEDGEDGVVAYADRSRFHRPECRYASLPGGEKIPRESAVRRGYDPCRVCKP